MLFTAAVSRGMRLALARSVTQALISKLAQATTFDAGDGWIHAPAHEPVIVYEPLPAPSESPELPSLMGLVYELLDALDDTAGLADGLDEPDWMAHLHYLQELQRVGRETIAWACVERLS